jgi:heat shock protein HtpX
MISKKMQIKEVDLLKTGIKTPASFAVNGRRKYVAISKSILNLLDPEEIEAVLAHELAHLKNKDTTIKIISLIYRTILLFDPSIHLIEAAINREREYLADETAATVTGNPLSLASALLKIHEFYAGIPPIKPQFMAIIGYGRGAFSKYPSLEQRIDRLVRMAN